MTRSEHLAKSLDAKRKMLAWKLMRIDEGTLRTWADYGHGKIETTIETRDSLKETLALVDQILR